MALLDHVEARLLICRGNKGVHLAVLRAYFSDFVFRVHSWLGLRELNGLSRLNPGCYVQGKSPDYYILFSSLLFFGETFLLFSVDHMLFCR